MSVNAGDNLGDARDNSPHVFNFLYEHGLRASGKI